MLFRCGTMNWILFMFIGTVVAFQDEPLDEKFRSLRQLQITPYSGVSIKTKDVRLPTHIMPTKYKVKLVPFIIPDNYTIKGYTEIEMKCVASGSKNVTIHIADIVIDESSVVVTEIDSGSDIPVTGHFYDTDREFYIVELEQHLQKGNMYKIKIEFTAALNDGSKGFYRTKYLNEEGKNVTIANTQFQATNARRAFPCFDEPGLKAQFEVSLGRTRNMSSISNMPIKSDGKGVAMKEDNAFVWDIFEESMPMSTYLVAFVVSDFEYKLAPSTGNNITFKIWARKSVLDQTDYAQGIGAKMLKYFEDYLVTPYPLPKQDMIALPEFSAGAMENWGLTTYREKYILYKPGVSAIRNKQQIASTIGHQLVHQWLGNLVTPDWWTDLWLSEGLSRFVKDFGIEAVQPELKPMEQFVSIDLHNVMTIDVLDSSRPISIQVEHPDELLQTFDRISYSKGAALIRMMNHFLTPNSFRKGLTNYLTTFKFKAASQDYLWSILTKQAHKDGSLRKDMNVKDIMDTWTLQKGFPVVNVKRNYTTETATISQEHYMARQCKSYNQWWVPITYSTPGKDFNHTYSKIWLNPNEGARKLTGIPTNGKPVIFNVQQTGYYRVNYDIKNWKMIIQQLNNNHAQIHVINRAQIINDAFNLARTGHLDYKLALDVTSYLNKETEFIPWKAALDGFRHIDTMLRRSRSYGEFRRYMNHLIIPMYKKVGYKAKNNEEIVNVYLRSMIVKWACYLNVDDCKENLSEDFQNWMDETNEVDKVVNKIDVNLKKTVYCSGIAGGGEEAWDFGWDQLQNTTVASEKHFLLKALACTRDIWLLNRYLNMSLTPRSGVLKQDAKVIITSVAQNPIGRDLAFDFIQDKWSEFLEHFADSRFAFPNLLKKVLQSRNTRFEVDELTRFQNDFGGNLLSGKREVEQAIEKGRNNIDWMDKHFKTIFEWLQRRNKLNECGNYEFCVPIKNTKAKIYSQPKLQQEQLHLNMDF